MSLSDELLGGPALVYDGKCPFCANYVRWLRLRDSLPCMKLVDARQGGPIAEEIERRGVDIDAGMVLILDRSIFHGADCVHRVALMTTSSTWFNRLNGRIFRSHRMARILYPLLRELRKLALWLLRRERIRPKCNSGISR